MEEDEVAIIAKRIMSLSEEDRSTIISALDSLTNPRDQAIDAFGHQVN